MQVVQAVPQPPLPFPSLRAGHELSARWEDLLLLHEQTLNAHVVRYLVLAAAWCSSVCTLHWLSNTGYRITIPPRSSSTVPSGSPPREELLSPRSWVVPLSFGCWTFTCSESDTDCDFSQRPCNQPRRTKREREKNGRAATRVGPMGAQRWAKKRNKRRIAFFGAENKITSTKARRMYCGTSGSDASKPRARACWRLRNGFGSPSPPQPHEPPPPPEASGIGGFAAEDTRSRDARRWRTLWPTRSPRRPDGQYSRGTGRGTAP